MKPPKKSTARYNTFYRFHPSRSQKSFVGFVIGFLTQWCRHHINTIKSTENFSHRKVDRVIWIAGLIVFAIALIEAASLDGQKNGAATLVLDKPVPITEPQNVRAVVHQR